LVEVATDALDRQHQRRIGAEIFAKVSDA